MLAIVQRLARPTPADRNSAPILKDSPILILDEATSELDWESEMLVQRALSNLMVDAPHSLSRTGFPRSVALTKLSSSRRHHPRVRTHQEFARGGTYARLYEMQFADADEPATPATTPGTGVKG